MYRFWESIIEPVLKMSNATNVVEIGAQNGYTTQKLIEHMKNVGGIVHSVDPFPNFDYKEWEKKNGSAFSMHIGLSLDILPQLEPADVYLVDGDHNWYTVYNELNLIKKKNRNRDVLVILHDIAWPYARRDLYYNPDNIPEKYRNPYAKKGIKYGYDELQDEGINAGLCNAIDVSIPQNGVLTAIEDFIKESEDYEYVGIECCNGLGVIKKKKTFDEVFVYLNDNNTLKKLIAQTEKNRIDFFQQRYLYKEKYEKSLEVCQKERSRIKKLQTENNRKDGVIEQLVGENVGKIDVIKKLEEQNRYNDTAIKRLEEENTEKNDIIKKMEEQDIQNNSIIQQLEMEISEKSRVIIELEEARENDEKLKQIITEKNKEIKNYNKQIEKLLQDNAILREEGKQARKELRNLKKQLSQIVNTRKFRIMRWTENCYKKVRKKVCTPYKMFRSMYQQVKNPSILIDAKSEPEIRKVNVSNEMEFPEIMPYEKLSIYGENAEVTTVTVVVCIHNALGDVIECLNSLWKKRTFPYEIVLVDDGSEEETKEYVERFSKIVGCRLYRNESAIGYTKSANIGLKATNADYVILLNSDTIVTDAWVEKMLDCFENNSDTGIVSPLSNAASYQSVPEIRDEITGDWKINTLSGNMTVGMMAMIVEKASKHRYPCVAALNGFCFMIKRNVIDTIGFLDEENFPRGYGEEVDYCIRATKAGFQLRVVDDTYVFHEKSKSFTHETRKELGAASKPVLKKKHGAAVYSEIGKEMDKCVELSDIRKDVTEAVEVYTKVYDKLQGKKIAFLLTAKGGSGGANSVCQEVMGMRELGLDANVINSSNYKEVFENNYPEMIPYTEYYNKKSDDSLLKVAEKYDVILGTIFTTIKKLQIIKERFSDLQCGYYVQDYEPYFYNESDSYYNEAKESYTKIADICLFAKTQWIADIVKQYHGVEVNLVEPSIDTHLYNPYVLKRKKNEKICICAMVRPKTDRRNPVGTMNVLNMIKNKYEDKVEITIFGCEDKEVRGLGNYNFEFHNLGILKRWEVAQLLAESDIFVDMSSYQAFGRTGLEGMCLGCVPVLPQNGGTNKFAVSEWNALLVDTLDDEAVFYSLCQLIDNRDKLEVMRSNALQTGKGYKIGNAAWSEMVLLSSLV